MPGDTESLYHCSSICWTSGVLQRPSALPCCPLSCACLLQGQPGRKGFPGKPGPDGSKVRRCGPPWGGSGGRGASLTYKAPGQALNLMASEVGEKSGPYSSQILVTEEGQAVDITKVSNSRGCQVMGYRQTLGGQAVNAEYSANTWGASCECGVQCRHSGGRL